LDTLMCSRLPRPGRIGLAYALTEQPEIDFCLAFDGAKERDSPRLGDLGKG